MSLPPSRRGRPRPCFDRLESRQMLAGGLGHVHAARNLSDLNVVYSTDVSGAQRLDVRLPTGQAPAGGWPVVLAIHGGGWRRLDKTGYETTVDPTLLSAGFAVVAPDYTLSARGRPSWPENLDELRGAVVWVKENAPRFDFNPDQVAAMGESAGGHLALMLGTDPGPSSASGVTDTVDAVVDFYGPTDLAALDHESPAAAPAVVQYVGGTPAQFPAQYADASPVTHVSAATPPVLIVQGADDLLVPPEQSQELARVLDSAGVPNQLVLVNGASHGFGLVASGVDLGPTVVGFLRDHSGP